MNLLHLLAGISLIVLPNAISSKIKAGSLKIKSLSTVTAIISWLLLLPSASLYLKDYPSHKALIKAGTWPWAHTIIMETKEHWGLALPIIATTAALLVYAGKSKASLKWWQLTFFLAILMAILGIIVVIGINK